MTHAFRFAVVAALLLASVASPIAQGPPPEIRALIDGVVQAANGDDGGWEALAQKSYAPAFLQQQTPAERAAFHKQIVDRFGAPMAPGGVRRQGPSAPLELGLKGSKASGTLFVWVNDNTFQITNLSLDPPATAPANSDPNAPKLPPMPINGTMSSDEIDRRLNDYFTQLAKDDVFSGVALVAKNGVPVFLRAYGFADRDGKVPNTIRTRFNIASINKIFTQAVINQLVSEGKLSVTDTLGKFFPDYPQTVSRTATIDQLLNMRGGVADFFGPQFNAANKQDFAANADYFRFVGSLPPVFAPGERSQYCNGCYIALGAIIAKVSGMPYERYVAENVWARAEMTSTGFARSDQPAPDIALGYTRAGVGALRSNITMHGVTGSAAGGSYSTVLDLLTYVKAMKAGKFKIPGTDGGLAIAGGAPGTNGIVESEGEWTVIVLTNFDPPMGQTIGTSLARALR